jgi:hypothetical protein
MILSVLTIFAQSVKDMIPMHKLKVQTALATSDIISLQNEIMQNIQPRGGFKVIWTHVYDRTGSEYWNNFEIQEHQYQGLHPAQLTSTIVTQNTSGSWQNYQRYTPNYVAGSYTSYSSYLYENWSGGQWVNYYRTLYAYNQFGNFQTIIGQMWQSGAWQNFSYTTYYYDANQSIDYLISQTWTNGAWVNSLKTVYTFGSNGKVSQMVFHYWLNNSWTLSSRQTYTYNANDDYNTILTQIWNPTSSNYTNSSRATYTYTQYNNTQTVYESWTNNAWQSSTRMLYDYDTSDNNIETITQNYSSGWVDYQRRMMEYEFWDVANEDDYAPLNPLQMRISPNPAISYTTVYIKSDKAGRGKLEVYNLKGEMCSSQDITIELNRQNSFNLDTSFLPSGVYLIKAEAAGQRQVNRMVVIK